MQFITRHWAVALLIAAFVAAAALRLPGLDTRPMHGDEANQAVKAGQLFEGKGYAYDPVEHHGPTLYYFTMPVLWLSGAKSFAETTETAYRLAPALFGVCLVLLLLPLRKGLGGTAMAWAAVFVAVSHAMVFYSRYYIQETLLVFFALGIIVAGWRYMETGKLRYALLTGLCLGMAHATKETCVVIFAAMAGALLLGLAWRREEPLPKVKAKHLVWGLVIAGVTSAVWFSSFLTHPRGVLDSVLTYVHYRTRAEGEGYSATHHHPWHFYLGLLAYVHRGAAPRWSEAAPMLLGMAGMISALRPRKGAYPGASGPLVRFLALYTILLTVFYALIPYKTPWNLLVFWQPWLMMAGVGVAAILRRLTWMPLQAWFICFLLFFTWQLSDQTVRGITDFRADTRNPYVYAHTTTAIRRLVKRFDEIAAVHPRGKDMRINVVCPTGDYWPLPWYLRGYSRVGYWHTIPDPADADMLVIDPAVAEALDKVLKDDYFREFHAIRPSVLRPAYIKREWWDAFIETRR